MTVSRLAVMTSHTPALPNDLKQAHERLFANSMLKNGFVNTTQKAVCLWLDTLDGLTLGLFEDSASTALCL